MPRHDLIAGLDIGTTKTCCVVAELGEGTDILISGVGVSPSTGLKKGIVVDIDATVHSIEDAVVKAARQSGRDISTVFVGVTGEHITSLNSRGVTAITHPDREISEDDVERVLEQSRVIVIPPDRIILHAIPRSYSLDGQNGIKHPVGMSGSRLEVETHIVTGGHTFLQNVEKCVTRAGLQIDDMGMVLEPIATSCAVVLPAEKSLGVCMVDIGGGTSDLAIFQGGEIYYSAVVPVGGMHVTNDIATIFRMTTDDAEKAKIEHGNAVAGSCTATEQLGIRQIGSDEVRPIRKHGLCEIIEARMQELFHLVQKEIMKSGCHDLLPAGMVLTGGGSQLKGAADCASSALGMPVRIGKPGRIGGLGDSVDSPAFSTAVGLVQYGALQHHQPKRMGAGAKSFGGVFRGLSSIFSKFRTD